ncbi:MAG TPA: glycosyltransferase family 2 protein [Rhizomicrobium sp.]|nr:glycosyltransferase family 2 protein [Rhizomicrobium sp.]
MPLVSVIIACLNSLEHLPRALDSVLSQSFTDLELVIMDGDSKDGTPNYLRTLADPRVQWRSERDGGLTQAWNKAVELARGEWLIFLGADDYIWDPNVLVRAAPLLRAAGPVVLAFGEVCMVAEAGDHVVRHCRFDERALLEQLRGPEGLGLPHQGFFHRRTALEAQPFDESFRLAADYEFITRFTRESDFCFLPIGPIAAFRMGGLSTNPWVTMEAYREFARVHRLRGRPIWHGAWQRSKAYAKMLLKAALGAVTARRLINFSRSLRDLPPYR